MIRVTCNCGRELKVKDELAGKRVRCPECSAAVSIPGGSTLPAPPQLGTPGPTGPPPLPVRMTRVADHPSDAAVLSTDLRSGGGAVLPAPPAVVTTGGVSLTLFEKLTAQKQDHAIVSKVVERVLPILTSQEHLQYIAVQQKPLINWFPDCVVLTDRRLILYRPKLLGRVDFQDYIWRDLGNVRLSENVIGSTLSFDGAAGGSISLDYLPKEQARMLYRYAQEREEEVREERRLRQIEEDRARAGGVQIMQQIGSPGTAPGGLDPMQKLQQLKQLFEAGLLTATEYDQKRAEIVAQL